MLKHSRLEVRAPLRVAAKLGGTSAGFTLVELLVVVSLIAALVALVLPSYAKARKQARAVMCLSNMHQIAAAMHSYTLDYADRFPIAHYFEAANGLQVDWDTSTRAGSADPATAGLIWQYAAGGAAQQCPAYDGPSMTAADPYTGYNYNTTYIGRGQGENPYLGMAEAPAMSSQVRSPDRTALIGDGGWKNGTNKFMRAPLDAGVAEGTVHAGAQAYRHLDRTQVAYADGHGDGIRRRFRKPAARSTNERLLGWPRNGFLSPDDGAYHRGP